MQYPLSAKPPTFQMQMSKQNLLQLSHLPFSYEFSFDFNFDTRVLPHVDRLISVLFLIAYFARSPLSPLLTEVFMGELENKYTLHRARPDDTCECRRRLTCTVDDAEGSRLGMGYRREPSRVGSRSYPAGSGLRRPGGVREFRFVP
ncbi:hypothetical protein EVAR_80861_1 [Eumeta japonica]|uniref:Uncharacterized protein n=1 Tax=Eumeta variegata TaxID=151549 RepID=A0A4C1V050_EUMVA|nr:hypothetical protein EVAR_80861_1 [Eumeta japonica]